MFDSLPQILAIVGAGLVTGLLFAFSNFVMRALADLPMEQGMRAMQLINERIINPVFVIFFLGTPLACVLLLWQSIREIEQVGAMLTLAGAVLYLLGPLGITMTKNVPLNNQLAGTDACNADPVWIDYQRSWQFWNHVRTVAGTLAILLLSMGLVA
ncbi:anthrone oxygenase family protein [Rhodopirellula halodulae]|uniref:anthrone oxygenase family protein n=1 Tax=Rhodopirellula halodulae TaxID=2894198 RepID=UPI001E2FD423|nr:anthrone oxygenase family protein [Rhodopirellula sp. JC737]MCC9658230.1 DUF1772 domain-containing protein [Rhodopirellula sp. JC737]